MCLECWQCCSIWRVRLNNRGCPMESSKSGDESISFMQQMLHNKFLLLTVALAFAAAVYLCVGLFVLLSH